MSQTGFCGVCRFQGSDVRIMACGCNIHARCVPVFLVASFRHERGLEASGAHQHICPSCNNSLVGSIHLLPLWLDDLDKAVEIRKTSKTKGQNASGSKFQDFNDIEAEASYVHLSRSGSSVSASLSESDHHRTGRWTNAEVAYTDFLVDAFDNGKLPIAQGARLNDFLGDMLMCKGSRLTKKMKNAKLSSRSYELNANVGTGGHAGVDTQLLSSLEESFFKSISCEAARLELRFNVTKAWRSHFSNFCVQVGSSLLNVGEWLTSLEMMEQRAAKAEETIRKARRLRMGLALKTDVRAAKPGVFFNGMAAPPRKPKSEKIHQHKPQMVGSNAMRHSHSLDMEGTNSVTSSDDDNDADFISHILDFPENQVLANEGGPMVDDLSNVFDDIDEADMHLSSNNLANSGAGPFIEEMVSFMENENLPFEHVDIWVPSFNEGHEDLRLFHAGQGTRRDIETSLFLQLKEYGEYSTKFSFASGHGLPGRVYFTDEVSWECRIDEQDPKIFERAGGAKIYGIKTGFGLPLVSKDIGRIVVVFYGTEDVKEDSALIEKTKTALSIYCPKPTWKLVVEMGDVNQRQSSKHSAPERALTTRKQTASVSYSAPMASLGTSNRGMPAPAPICLAEDTQEEEQRIATMLGDYMPLCSLPPTDNSGDSSLVSYFLSLRLLLIRSPNRRSAQEAEKIDLIVKSYRGYAACMGRSEKEIANLLVQDWRYMSDPGKTTGNTASGSNLYWEGSGLNSISASPEQKKRRVSSGDGTCAASVSSFGFQ